LEFLAIVLVPVMPAFAALTNKPVNMRSADLYRIEDGIITGH
jgi:hypothetical protein